MSIKQTIIENCFKIAFLFGKYLSFKQDISSDFFF